MNSKHRCSQCREFFLVEEMYRGGVSGVCSEECLQGLVERARNKRARRKLHKEKRIRYGRRLPGGVRGRVRNRDRVCRWCGSSEMLQIHHVIYRSGGGPDREWNLILLCMEDHVRAHSDKKEFQPALLFCLMKGEEEGVFLTVPEALTISDVQRAEALAWGKEMLQGRKVAS